MSMATNLQGRLRNTNLPKTQGFLPVYEAVVNAIHAIEEAGMSSIEGRIRVEIIRSGQPTLDLNHASGRPGPDPEKDIVGFSIMDNGIGFNDDNMKAFEILDTDHKIDRGCRGVGRLLWLKAFRQISVASTFQAADATYHRRTFSFDTDKGVHGKDTQAASSSCRETTIRLEGFRSRYKPYSRKTAGAIAHALFEHCLWYYIREGSAPSVLVVDDDSTIDLSDVYGEHMLSFGRGQTYELKGHIFELTHVKFRRKSSQSNTIAFCAGNRLVKEESINGKIAGLFGRLKDGDDDFVYVCYVKSPYLDEKVRAERTDFDFDDGIGELFPDNDLSLQDIRQSVLGKAGIFLKDYLEENKKAGRSRVEEYVATTAPRYRPILDRMSEDSFCVDPATSDKELEIALHREWAEVERKLIADGQSIMAPQAGEDIGDYEGRVKDYLDAAGDIKKSDLASYVFHRKVVLDLLSVALERNPDGKYAREDLLHNLIMPRHKDSNHVHPDSCNLWLIDERLAFHDFLASDLPLKAMPITGDGSAKKPDLCALNVFDNPTLVAEGSSVPLASIVVIEMKRPMRDDAQSGEDKDPIDQALGYLDRIRGGRVMTARGRPIPGSDQIPGYCYILCDMTPSMLQRCRAHNGNVTSDGLGYFYYHNVYKAYVEVMSYDGLVKAAKERNRAFFDKLGLPTT